MTATAERPVLTTTDREPKNIVQLLHLIGERHALLARRAWGVPTASKRVAVVWDGVASFRFAGPATALAFTFSREDLMARDWYEVPRY